MIIRRSLQNRSLNLRHTLKSIGLIGAVFPILGDWQRAFMNKLKVMRLPRYVLYDAFPNFAPNSAATPMKRTYSLGHR